MSLLSVRNFVAPLTHTGNLVTLLLVAVLLAFLRIAGGGLYVSSNKNTVSTSPGTRSESPESISGFNPEARRKSAAGSAAGSKTLDDTLREALKDDKGFIEEMTRASKSVDEQKKREAAAQKQKKSGALDDIEKRLGIR